MSRSRRVGSGQAAGNTCERATATGIRELTHLLLADEVDHARLGWGLLAMPTLGDDVRAIVGGVVPGMCDGILRSWRSAPALRIDLSAHGCVPWHDVDELVCSTLRDLVLPGFQVLGVDTAPTRRWFDTIPAGAPTHSLA